VVGKENEVLEEGNSRAGDDSGLEVRDGDRLGILASEIKSRESRWVGGLLSWRESDMHHEPSGGAPIFVGSARATKKVIFHRRAAGKLEEGGKVETKRRTFGDKFQGYLL